MFYFWFGSIFGRGVANLAVSHMTPRVAPSASQWQWPCGVMGAVKVKGMWCVCGGLRCAATSRLLFSCLALLLSSHRDLSCKRSNPLSQLINSATSPQPAARSHTITANSNKASATRQTQQQQTAKQALQSKQHSNRSPLPLPTASADLVSDNERALWFGGP